MLKVIPKSDRLIAVVAENPALVPPHGSPLTPLKFQVEAHRSSDPVDGQIAVHDVPAPCRLDPCRSKEDLRVHGDVEEIRRAQMVIAVLVTRINRRGSRQLTYQQQRTTGC
jgi:hypothetical protein